MSPRALLGAVARLAGGCSAAAVVLGCHGTAATADVGEAATRASPTVAPPAERLHLGTRDDPRLGRIARGTFTVPEDRADAGGRSLELDVVVLHARSTTPAPDPIFFLAGGPGQDATTLVEQWVDHPMRAERDIVLVSQRGTGGSMRLGCDHGNDADLQTYLRPMFVADAFRDCLAELSARADLTQYSTAIAMDDLNEVREALGYAQIDLYGGSYGTRAALVYMRQHPATVRCAILEGVAPLAFTNPLFHAREAQAALDAIFAECEATPGCRAAFPDLRAEFERVLARLAEPVAVTVSHPETAERVEVSLDRAAFAEALRVLMYYLPTSRQVPLLVHRAAEGDFEPFASAAIASNRALRRSVAFGMLLCVTCSEDVARIAPGAIERETAGTFLGDARVRQQSAVCSFWPRSELPRGFGADVSVGVPTLVLSGTIDPVTSPSWGAEAARHLQRSRHVVVPGAHGVDDPCVEAIRLAFLADPDVDALDTGCVEAMRLPPFELGG